MIDGRLRQAGAVDSVFDNPSDADVAQAVGIETICPARVISRSAGLVTVDIAGACLVAVDTGGATADVFACIRAESVTLENGAPGSVTSARNHLRRPDRLGYSRKAPSRASRSIAASH